MNAQDAQNLLATYGIVAIGIYFLPTIVAALRGHLSSGAIFVLNLLLGWTALFWILALVWAFTSNTRANQRISAGFGPTPKPLDWLVGWNPNRRPHEVGIEAVDTALDGRRPVGLVGRINRWAADYAERHPN